MRFARMPLYAALLAAAALSPVVAEAGSSWTAWGGTGSANTRNADGETRISPATAPQLVVKWRFRTGNDISATPTIEGNDLYVTDWGGYVYKLDRLTGKRVWRKSMPDYTGNRKSFSRSSPAIGDSLIVVGDRGGGATLLGIDKKTGGLTWRVLLDTDKTAIVTGSPIIVNGVVYVGVSSSEELLPNADKATFRGSIVALDAATGKQLWKSYTVPQGYAGGAVWSSTPAVDTARGIVYVTTGNNVAVPDSVASCVNGTTDPVAQLACSAPDNYFDAVLALDLQTGKPKWAHRLNSADAWFVDCLLKLPGCQLPGSPDFDFGSGANLISTSVDGQPLQLVGAGQKSGVYWGLDPDTGDTRWATQVGPGSFLGGIMWGPASDGQRVYVAVSNVTRQSFVLAGNNGQSWNGGSVAALDVATGKFVWQVPQLGSSAYDKKLPSTISPPLTIANGVLFAGSADGTMAALDAASGKTLWQFASDGSVMSGPSVVDGWVYWGAGYAHLGLKGGKTLYAFGLPD